MKELQETRTLEQVASEIRTITASMLVNVIEIGRRMCEAKQMLPHGAFGAWIEQNTDYSSSTANNFMRLFEAYGNPQKSLFGAELSNCQTIGNLSYSKALQLLAIPDADAREAFIAEHDVEQMTTRELKEAIKKADNAEARAEDLQWRLTAADAQLADAKKNAEELKNELEELKNRPIEVAVEKVPDREAEEKLKKKLEKAEAAKREAEAAKKKAEEALAAAQKSEAETERTLSAKIDALEKRAAVASSEEKTEFKMLFEGVQQDVNKMLRCCNALREKGDGEGADKLTAALRLLMEKTLEAMG